MTYKEIAEMIEEIGLPCAYNAFKSTLEGPPFVCWLVGDSSDFSADNENYIKIERLHIELYTDERDFSAEADVEAVLRSRGIVWVSSGEYIDDERMYQRVWETDVIIKGEDNA